MNLYERYLSGETKVIYEEIYALGQDAFNQQYLFELIKC